MGSNSCNIVIPSSKWGSSGVGSPIASSSYIEEEDKKEPNSNITSVFEVYPNPTQGRLTIKRKDENKRAEIIMRSISGRTVKTIEMRDRTKEIHTNNFPRGLYIFEYGGERIKVVIE